MAAFLRPNLVEQTENTQRCDAIAYYRLSKFGKYSDSDSIANQRKLIRQYVENHEELNLVDEAYDDGYTGTNYDRPGFNKVLKAIENGKANCVIVKDLSRLGREYIETGKYLEMTFPSMGVRFIAVNDDIDSEHSNESDDLLISMKNIMNESYCRDLSKKLRKQFRVQRANGEFLGAFACYGYRKDPEDRHKLVIDEYAAEVVRGIFQLRIKGYSHQSIADYLNHEGVLPPSEYKKRQGLSYKSGFQTARVSAWGPMAIRSILLNPVYIGTLIQGKRGTPNYKVKQMRVRSEKEWSVVEHNHDPIVDELVFHTVQQLMKQDTRTAPESETVQPLAGVLFCADCGRSMCRRSVKQGDKTFYYYICSTSKKGGDCSGHSIAQEKLENAVLRAISGQIDMIVEMERLLSEIGLDNIRASRLKRMDVMIAEKTQEIETTKDFRMKLVEAYRDDLIDKSEYDMMRMKYSQMIESSQNGLSALMEQRRQLNEETTGARSWVESFLKYRDSRKLTREMVATLVNKIEVFEDKRLKIRFNYKDEMASIQEALASAAKEVG